MGVGWRGTREKKHAARREATWSEGRGCSGGGGVSLRGGVCAGMERLVARCQRSVVLCERKVAKGCGSTFGMLCVPLAAGGGPDRRCVIAAQAQGCHSTLVVRVSVDCRRRRRLVMLTPPSLLPRRARRPPRRGWATARWAASCREGGWVGSQLQRRGGGQLPRKGWAAAGRAGRQGWRLAAAATLPVNAVHMMKSSTPST